MQSYLVGGAVRDKLLGLPVADRDWVVVGSTVDEMEAAGFKQVGRQFPVFLHPQTQEEYALARTERKTGPGYTGFVVHAAPDVTLDEDLKRRDLTINAIAQSEQGELIDPFNGQADLEQGVLRHVSEAFSEDPVRILRIARFAARYCHRHVGKQFLVAEETMELMKKMVSDGETDNLIPERVWQELAKALSEKAPRQFFEVLNECGAISQVYPGSSTQLQASLNALDYAMAITPSPAALFAALCSPLDIKQIESLCKRLIPPKEFRELALLTRKHLNTYSQGARIPTPKQLQLLKSVDAFRRTERFQLYLRASEASVRATPNQGEKPHPQREYWLALYHAAAPISASDMMKRHLAGAAMAEEIDKHRCAAMAKIKRTYRWAYFNVQV